MERVIEWKIVLAVSLLCFAAPALAKAPKDTNRQFQLYGRAGYAYPYGAGVEGQFYLTNYLYVGVALRIVHAEYHMDERKVQFISGEAFCGVLFLFPFSELLAADLDVRLPLQCQASKFV